MQNINYIILGCNFQLILFAVAACGSVYCTACSVFLCLLLVSDDSPLTEPSEAMVARVGCWQIHCLAVPSVCTRSLCLARGLSLAPRRLPAPLLLNDDNDKREGGEWAGCENPSRSQLMEPEPFNMFLKILLNEDKQHCITRHRPGIQLSLRVIYSSHARHFRGYFCKVSKNEDWFRARTWLSSTLSSSSFSVLLTIPPSSCQDRAGQAMALSLSLCSFSIPVGIFGPNS